MNYKKYSFSKKLNIFFSVSFLNKILKFSTIILIINLFLFASVLFQKLFLGSGYGGDEIKYLEDLLKATQFGLSTPILEGSSIPYLFLSYYLNKILENPLLSLRLVSLISGIIMFLFLLRLRSNLIKTLVFPVYLWLLYLLVIQTTIFSAVNDILLDLFGTIFFILLLKDFKKINLKLISLGICLALILATRKMAVTYIAVILFLYFIFSFITTNKLFKQKNLIIIMLTFVICFLLINSYPLAKIQKLSFDDKILKGEVTWAQWDYHNTILINQGVQERFKHVSIEETKNYLKKNGEDSLPANFYEMIWFDPIVTFKEFFFDLFTSLKYILRQIGLLLFAFIYFLIFRFKKILNRKHVSVTDFIYLFTAIYLVMISFIVIADIQSRWFMFFLPIMLILIEKDLMRLSHKRRLIFCISNNIILTVMCYPFFNKILTNLMI